MVLKELKKFFDRCFLGSLKIVNLTNFKSVID